MKKRKWFLLGAVLIEILGVKAPPSQSRFPLAVILPKTTSKMNLKSIFKFFENKNKKKIGCPACFDKNNIGFGFDYLNNNFISQISEKFQVGEIKIYSCENCKTDFLKKETTYEKVFPGQIETLKKWNNSNLKCSESLKIELDKIGLSNDYESNPIVPCKIKTKNNQEFDFTTVQFSNKPPIGYYYTTFQNIFFIDEISEIKASLYSLSKDIRKTTEKIEEKRMGFYPTVLKTKKNEKVVINGITLFFSSHNIKGSELELANVEWNHNYENYLYESEKMQQRNLVIAKK